MWLATGRSAVRAMRRSTSRSSTLLNVPLAAMASTPPTDVATATVGSSSGPAARPIAASATSTSSHHSFGLVSVTYARATASGPEAGSGAGGAWPVGSVSWAVNSSGSGSPSASSCQSNASSTPEKIAIAAVRWAAASAVVASVVAASAPSAIWAG